MTVERSAMSKASNLKRTVIPVLAELECDGVGNFEVKSERFSVGRGQNSNMPIASSNLVSRKHIEVGLFRTSVHSPARQLKKRFKSLLRNNVFPY